MTKRMSIFLDAVRFLAAVVVLAGHLTQPRFSRIGLNWTGFAANAVAVFFVLSGFVISFVVETKERTARTYAISRLSRLYSVLIPATIVSLIAYFIVLPLEPGLVHVLEAEESPLLAHPYGLVSLVSTSLLPWTFLSSFHARLLFILPALDLPIWSLAYEFAYYAVFAVWAFGRGYWKVLGVALGCVLMGRAALELFPLWLLGVWLRKVALRVGTMKRWRTSLGLACLLGLTLTVAGWHRFFAWSDAPHSPRVWYLLHTDGRVAIPDAFYAAALLMLFLVLSVAAFQHLLGPVFDVAERPIRWLAGNTFSIYLFHLPLLAVLHVVPFYNPASRVGVAIVFVVDFFLCVLLAQVSEHKKAWWRSFITRIFIRTERMFTNLRAIVSPMEAE